MSHRDNPIKKNKELSKPMDLFNVGFTGNVGTAGGYINAVGASFSQSGGYDYYIWTGNGSLEVVGYEIEVLIVGGGGGGILAEFFTGGGGGGTFVLRGQDLLLSVNRAQKASNLKGQNISLA